MKKITLLLLSFICLIPSIYAVPGDTTVIQTFRFSDGRQSRRGVFDFPDGNVSYEKILMYYTLKCDPTKNPACGEWDYIVYTELAEPIDTVPDRLGNDSIVYRNWKLSTYITPYGYGINLGEGWTWVFDVTDFAPLLKGKVTLQDGNYQELLDLKFVFVEGVPVREVKSIRQIYNGNYPLNQFDNFVKDTTVLLRPEDKMVKLRTTVTGHDFDNATNCAEFCPKIHTLKANGKAIESWNIIRSCSDNPLYPQ
ncbi:MAG: hypothetical protein LBN18_07445, partial [Dysgonamonadaceae bacterium]|nr:hypothetical protein [Dysgonamonadaceae bacterium]